jgi:hypothetical protein
MLQKTFGEALLPDFERLVSLRINFRNFEIKNRK